MHTNSYENDKQKLQFSNEHRLQSYHERNMQENILNKMILLQLSSFYIILKAVSSFDANKAPVMCVLSSIASL